MIDGSLFCCLNSDKPDKHICLRTVSPLYRKTFYMLHLYYLEVAELKRRVSTPFYLIELLHCILGCIVRFCAAWRVDGQTDIYLL